MIVAWAADQDVVASKEVAAVAVVVVDVISVVSAVHEIVPRSPEQFVVAALTIQPGNAVAAVEIITASAAIDDVANSRAVVEIIITGTK